MVYGSWILSILIAEANLWIWRILGKVITSSDIIWLWSDGDVFSQSTLHADNDGEYLLACEGTKHNFNCPEIKLTFRLCEVSLSSNFSSNSTQNFIISTSIADLEHIDLTKESRVKISLEYPTLLGW